MARSCSYLGNGMKKMFVMVLQNSSPKQDIVTKGTLKFLTV